MIQLSFALLTLGIVSALALFLGAVGLYGVLSCTVAERTREIGVRMAVGASRKDILWQFLLEAVMISVGGGMVGILAGVALPLSVSLATDMFRIPISAMSILIAFAVSLAVGLIFGVLPARRAARLNPTEALRYE